MFSHGSVNSGPTPPPPPQEMQKSRPVVMIALDGGDKKLRIWQLKSGKSCKNDGAAGPDFSKNFNHGEG